MKLYSWQQKCLQAWEANRFRGIAHVVTGAGKTFLAMNAMELYLACYPDARIKIVVPTIPLAHQWQLAVLHHFSNPELRPGFFGGGIRETSDKRIMIYIINSARDSLSRQICRDFSLGRHVLLICDECHHYQSPQNRRIFDFTNSSYTTGEQYASLGLSATPFGTANDDILTRALGSEIYHYDVKAASSDGVVSPFIVSEVAVSFLPNEQEEYKLLSQELILLQIKLLKEYPELKGLSSTVFMKAVTRIAHAAGMDPQNTAVAFLLKAWQRKEISTLAYSRIICAVSLIETLPQKERILIFCERITQAEQMAHTLNRQFGSICALYHSHMTREARQRNMADFRNNRVRILVSCRCLDEGIDVPDATVGIVLSCSAITRQRIQRLGRILRRAEGKETAVLYYLYIQESADEPSFLPGLDNDKRFPLCFRTREQDFENDLYVYVANRLLQQGKQSGLTEPQFRELRCCILEGLTRGDYLLSEPLQSRRIKESRTRHEHNYWQAMKIIGHYFRKKDGNAL